MVDLFNFKPSKKPNFISNSIWSFQQIILCLVLIVVAVNVKKLSKTLFVALDSLRIGPSILSISFILFAQHQSDTSR